ncbi:meckelin [Raphidocelis subcapitata]|uniref:Meckelin n=1 Tax=Raphidocelis subcapitata TaxID=307507 RepID=A0A2V0P8F6_9CHLO|nr:meckelin [Raphidocelis subcapitata]|eukprot:GBF95222.1 meckelin [Raphidocelis subcapitata]
MAGARAAARRTCAAAQWWWRWCAVATAALCLRGAGAQQASPLSVAFQFPCQAATEYFDAAALVCKSCDQANGFFPAPDGLGCVLCDSSTGSDASFAGGFTLAASWQPAALSAAGRCGCAAPGGGLVVADMAAGGRRFRRCVMCPTGWTADAAAGVCAPASGAPRTPEADLVYTVAALNARGAGINLQTATQATIQAVLEPSGASPAYVVDSSAPLERLLGPAARECMDDASPRACNALANLCALQLYSPDAAACVMYDELVLLQQAGGAAARARRGSASSTPRPATGPLPWLLYAPGSDYTAAGDVGVTVSLATGSAPLRLVLARFDTDGTWLGLVDWSVQLQVCGAGVENAGAWTRFGTSYAVSCSVGVASLRAVADYGSPGPRLYDPYIVQDDGTLYPLPAGSHVRRFFLVDDTLSTPSGGAAPRAVVYPSSLELAFAIRADRRDHITPPLLTITYSALQADGGAASAAARAPASFSVSYSNAPQLARSFWYAWQTLLVVLLVVCGGPVWAWRVARYLRRRSAQPADAELLLFAGLAAVDAFSGALVAALVLVSLYWLALAKLQEEVHLLVPPDSGMYNFWVTLVLAVVGQAVGLLWVLYEQVNVDVFFLDWEKPRRVLAKGGAREDAAPVSAWRGLLVANEWNELQAARATSPPLTLLAVAALLDGAGFATAGYLAPDAAGYAARPGVASSMLLRFGATAGWFLVLGAAQWLWRAGVAGRVAGEPLGNFVDLLFLANTSAVVLDERTGGYYLHGRNHMHHADTTLSELNASLMREEEGLVSRRGLVTTYAGAGAAALNDNQTFTIVVTPELRRLYESTLLAQVEQAALDQRMSRGVVTSAVRGPLRPREGALAASREITAAFAAAIDEAERNHATQVIVPTYWQRALRMPPDAPAGRTLLAHDFGDSFSRVLFLGRELRLFVFEALLFCAIDSALRRAVVSALAVLGVWLVLRAARLHFGQSNLSRKTLVDKHFLI